MLKGRITCLKVEKIMQEARDKDGFNDMVEIRTIKNAVELAKQNGRMGDKVQCVVNPLYIHIPTWQRDLCYDVAETIGKNYVAEKWDAPKVYYDKGKLYCADGMHRLFGAFLTGKTDVVIELLFVNELQAIELFLDQTKDRRKMSPSDILNASIRAGRSEWIELQKICNDYKVNIKGSATSRADAIGTLTSITDGVNLVRIHPETFKAILTLLQALEWGEGAYNAKVIRSLRQCFAVHGVNKASRAILCRCKGREYFKLNISNKCQYAATDFLSEIIRTTKPYQLANFARLNKDNNIVTALKEAMSN